MCELRIRFDTDYVDTKEPQWRPPVATVYDLYDEAQPGWVCYVTAVGKFYFRDQTTWKVMEDAVIAHPVPPAFELPATLSQPSSVRTLLERDRLPVGTTIIQGYISGSRKLFMPLWVAETGKCYVLDIPGFDALTDAQKLVALADNSYWREFGGGSGGDNGNGGNGGNGGSSAPSAFVGNRTVSRAGLPNINVGGTNVVEFLNNYFFPAEPPTATLTADKPIREFGSSPFTTLTFTAVRRENPIVKVIVNGVEMTSPSGSVVTSTPLNTDATFTMSVTDGGAPVTTTTTVQYQHYRFWFVSSNNLLTAEEAVISALLRPMLTKEFAKTRQQTRTLNPTTQYLYFAYPTSFGEASFLLNGLANNDWGKRLFTYTNSQGYTTLYVLYRSGRVLNNSFTAQLL